MKNKTKYNTFDSFAEKYEQYVSNFLGDPWIGWDDLSGKSAIDIGCGAGHAAEILSEKYDKVIGLDLCSKLIELAKQKHNNSNIEYIAQDIMNFETEEKFDFVYSHTMMHHLEDYENGLLKIKSLVSKGGKLVIIDNVCDKYRTPPGWAYTIPAKIEFIPNIFKIGIKRPGFYSDSGITKIGCIIWQAISIYQRRNSKKCIRRYFQIQKLLIWDLQTRLNGLMNSYEK